MNSNLRMKPYYVTPINESDYYALDWMGFEWSPWRSLNPADGELSEISTNPGIYRVRHLDRDGLTYIGQTGRSLRGRLRALAGCYDEEMPYTAHVAAPSLWAVRQEYGPAFQVSVIEPDNVDHRQRRLSIEQALIAVSRRESGENTTANFARIIEGYKRSSRRADGFTGGELSEGETESNSASGVGPLAWTDADESLVDGTRLDRAETARERVRVADRSGRVSDLGPRGAGAAGVHRTEREPEESAVSAPAEPGRSAGVQLRGGRRRRREAQARPGRDRPDRRALAGD